MHAPRPNNTGCGDNAQHIITRATLDLYGLTPSWDMARLRRAHSYVHHPKYAIWLATPLRGLALRTQNLVLRTQINIQGGAQAEIVDIHAVAVDAAAAEDERGKIRIIAGRPKPPVRATLNI